MFSTAILDVAIGLCMMYLLISLVCTVAVEWVAAYFNWRSNNLKTAIKSLLTGNASSEKIDLLAAFYAHPRIKSLSKDNNSEPSSISSSVFADTVIDMLLEPGSPDKTAEVITKRALDELDENGKNKYLSYVLKSTLATEHIQKTISSLIARPKMEIDQFRESVEHWYDETQARAQGWYKRRTHIWNLGIAFVICLALNADTIQIANRIYADPALQKALVASASAYMEDAKNGENKTNTQKADLLLETMKKEIDQGSIYAYPIGWKGHCPKGNIAWLMKIAGIILTVFAINLGSQFWINTVRGLVELRLGGAKPPKRESKLEAGGN
ncbi:MAG: hypothetical protein OEZ32_07600 [Nitrospinota bacterium]|nr:hypothetical protein [Nitrospinota bacterium]